MTIDCKSGASLKGQIGQRFGVAILLGVLSGLSILSVPLWGGFSIISILLSSANGAFSTKKFISRLLVFFFAVFVTAVIAVSVAAQKFPLSMEDLLGLRPIRLLCWVVVTHLIGVGAVWFRRNFSWSKK